MGLDAVDVLMKARAYVEKGWNQGTFGRDQNGKSVTSLLPGGFNINFYGLMRASSWCISGAVALGARYGEEPTLTDEARSLVNEAFYLMRRVVGEHPVSWNDAEGRTQQEVLEALDKAIALGLRREAVRA